MPKYTPKPGHSLVLRTSDRNGRSHGRFQWPHSGPVEAPDWDPAPECGNGLHGLLNGQGNGHLLMWWGDNAIWQVVEVDDSDIVDLGGKVKFRCGTVVYSGDRSTAVSYFQGVAGVVFGTATAGDFGTATAGLGGSVTAGNYGTAAAGDFGTATAGSYGTATAGEGGTATAGKGGTATAGIGGSVTAGNYGTATAGYSGTATAGYSGTATAGDGGTATAGIGGSATAGYYGTATAGSYGTATAGSYGTATAGKGGTATAGIGGSATAGEGGTLAIYYLTNGRWRLAVAYVGEDGILPNIRYRLNENHEFEAVSE